MKPVKFLDFCEALELKNGYLVTINMQHIYELLYNVELRKAVVNNPNSNLCIDGRGARLIFSNCFKKKIPLVVGNEVLQKKLDLLLEGKILVIGSTKKTMDNVSARYPNLKFIHVEPWFVEFNNEIANSYTVELGNNYQEDWSLIAIAIGAPKAEILASSLSIFWNKTPIYCIGGSFEMLAGNLPRSPMLLQFLGLEGVWRFLIQPRYFRLLRLLKSYYYFVLIYLNPKIMLHIFEEDYDIGNHN